MRNQPPQKGQARSTNSGQAMMMTVVFFLFISLAVMLGLVMPAATETRLSRERTLSTQSFFLSESGIEDVIYRLKNRMTVDAAETLTLSGATVTTTITDTGSNEKDILAVADYLDNVRKTKTHITTATGASFSFGVQTGIGGLIIENSASINGNAYSNGPVTGANNNVIQGDVISGGPSGIVSGVHATGSVYAHTIQNAEIDHDAYYDTTISGSTVLGTLYPGSADQPLVDLPIADELIDQWKADAAAGGTLGGSCTTYTINSNVTLGPVKINCDVVISGSPTVTLAGSVWINGNLTLRNTPTIVVSNTQTGKTVAMIADNEASRLTSGKIDVQNANEFIGAGNGSYVLLVSNNTNAEDGDGTLDAISVANSANGDLLLYARHGQIHLQNNVDLKEVTAYRIKLSNNTYVTYESGLASLLFTSGPGGTWSIADWEETQ